MKITDPSITDKSLTTKEQQKQAIIPQTELRNEYEQLRRERYKLMSDKKILQPENQQRYREIKQRMSILSDMLE